MGDSLQKCTFLRIVVNNRLSLNNNEDLAIFNLTKMYLKKKKKKKMEDFTLYKIYPRRLRKRMYNFTDNI